MSSTPTRLTCSKAMTCDSSGQMSEDSSFHTAISPSVYTQSMDGNDAMKSTSNISSTTSENEPSFSHTPLTRQNVMVWDHNSGQMSKEPSFLTAVNCSSIHSARDGHGHPAELLGLDGIPDSPSGPTPPGHLPLSPCIPPGLKQSIQNTIHHNLQKYACWLDASLSNQIEFSLSEAFDFTLNVIE
ncbi:hypothetical protein SCLCIDRAFT_33565 [Scleroderma citrinum Foug A]|uniref:Uncharacterized protein n=1 Tax=Scleroderma citrinum Foug A TaxID=1036808 RepID=A0A0C3D5B7_9AGAM|nr:hypothetical protein SCLCIDRAFT_33565 [Scleroderma citrinum Foug A]